ncbi:ATP-binding protein [Phormidesmis sp. 146-35]
MRLLTDRFSKLAQSMPLRRVLVVPFILQISLAVGLTGWLSIRNGQQAVNEVAVQLRSEITARIQQYLQTYVETPHQINELNANAVRLGEIDIQNLAALEQHLWYQLETFDTVTAVQLGSESREHVAVERDDNNNFQVKVAGKSTDYQIRIYAADRPGYRTKLLRARPNYDPRNRPWYSSAVKSKKATWGGIYRLFATPKYVLNAGLPIHNNRNQLVGVASVDFSLTGIGQFLQSLKIGRSGETFILERQTGLLVGSSATQRPYVIQNPTAPLNQQNPVRVKALESSDRLTRQTTEYLQQRFGNLSQITQTQQLDFEVEGQRQFLQVVPLKTVQGLDWLIIVVVPESDFMDQIHANTRTTIVLCLGAFGLATALGILTARWIAQPISRLGSAAKAIAAGHLDQTVSVSSTTELNGLAQSFNQMAEQLRESFSALAKTNEELESRVEQRTTELGEKNTQLQQEIQERRKAEAALKTSETELRLMFAAMSDVVVVFDSEGHYLKYMQTQSVTDEPGVDLIGKTVHEVLPESIANLITHAIQQALNLRQQPLNPDGTRKHVFVEYCASIAHPETWFLASVSPLSDQAVLWVARDISKLKKTEAALKQAKESADAANLAKSQFLSNMSHELRTPLNIILGFTQLLLRSRSLNPQQQDYLDTINRSGEDLLTLINDVLEMSKIEAGRITLNETDFDLYGLLDRLQQMFALKAQSRGLQLIFERSPDVPHYIHADESKLRQILVNLIGNAIKFTQIGSVTVRVNSDQTPDPILRFSVEDTGCGIAASDLDRLFEPFVQTEAGHKAQEGTGLGLPISDRFVRLMGGNLSVDSTPEQGSTFTFEICTHAVTWDVLPAPIPHRQVVGLDKKHPPCRILIVEDKLENRRFLLELLAPVGFEVQEAINGQAAIDLWQSWSPDLIWMDLRMPVLNGFEATRQIKAAGNQAPVIIALTGSAFEEDRLTAMALGFDDFVRKPIQTTTVFEKIAEHLGVQYLYTDEQNNQSSPSHSLTAADLAEMPIDWINQLHQAALRINTKQVLQLIEQIPEPQDQLIQALTDLANHYCFEELIALTQPPHDRSDLLHLS